jgi:hypothetical protein
MGNSDSQLAIIEGGEFFMWSEPKTAAKLSSDPPYVGHPRAPLKAPDGVSCGLVTILGAEGHAGFTPITTLTEELIVHALFELRRGRD